MVVDDHDAQRGAHHRARRVPPRSVTSVPSPGVESIAAVPPTAAMRPATGVAQAAALGGHRAGVEARAVVAYEHLGAVGLDLGEDERRGARGVAGGVAQRLASRGGDRLADRVEGPVADDRHLDGDAVLVLALDLGDGVAQRGGERLTGELGLAGHPGAQRMLLTAGETGHGGGIVRVALDEGQRLQDGVVQVGGEALALVLAGRLRLPVVGAGEGGDEQRRADHDQDPDGEHGHEQQRPQVDRVRPRPAGVGPPPRRCPRRPPRSRAGSRRRRGHGKPATGCSPEAVMRCQGAGPVLPSPSRARRASAISTRPPTPASAASAASRTCPAANDPTG